jgi:putative ATP-binding cassette transporter
MTTRLFRRVESLADNFRQITSVNRNLGFFTTGYNYLIQIIPALVVAPLFIRGEVEFGVITQSAMAFGQVLGAFSLIVNQVQSLSSFAATIKRLEVMAEATGHGPPSGQAAIAIIENDSRLAYERLTLLPAGNGQALIKDLTVEIPRAKRVLVFGPNEGARLSLFRATAGLGAAGRGKLVRPTLDAICFLPQRPYLPAGTLRDLILPDVDKCIPDDRLTAALHDAGLDSVLKRAGGLDVEQDWPTVLSLAEQQQLGVIRLILARPAFAVLDRLTDALKPAQLQQCLDGLHKTDITYVSLTEERPAVDQYDAALEIEPDGTWHWRAATDKSPESEPRGQGKALV